jgi:hypothetical protein
VIGSCLNHIGARDKDELRNERKVILKVKVVNVRISLWDFSVLHRLAASQLTVLTVGGKSAVTARSSI